MYNPPAESPYTKSLSLDYFDLLEKEIAEYSLHGKLIVGGDLNARTGNASDFIVNDNSNHLPLFNDYISDDSINSRCNKDTFISTRGRQLNELCIQSGMRILNGRCLGDTLGNFTSYQPAGNSVIDYFIVSDSLLPYINFFKVHEYDGSLSDHCKISVMLSVKCFIHCNENRFLKRLPCRYIWNDESPHKFQTALNLNEVQLLIQKFVSENPSLNETEIDKMMENFTEIIHVASDMALKKE